MRALFQNSGFRRLWIASVILALGDAVMQMGLVEYFRFHDFDVSTETAKMLFAVSVPGVVFGPLAMAYLDRWQRRSVLIISDVLRAASVVVIAMWLLPEEPHGLMAVYAVIFVVGAITTFYYPARYALMPNLVATDDLIKANTLLTTSVAIAGVGGRAVGGLVAEQLGAEWAVLSNAVAYVASVALVWRIRMPPHATTAGEHAHPQGGWGELKVGLVYLWEHPTALPLVMLTTVFAFMGGVFVVAFVGFALADAPQGLGLRTGGFGYLFAALGVGAALGIIAVGRGGRWTRATWLPFVQLIGIGVFLVLMSMTLNAWVAAALLVVLGSLAAPLLIPVDAKLQEQVDERRRGAVFAARGLLTSATMCLAFWLQFGSRFFRDTPSPTILRWLGIGSIIAAALAMLSLRSRNAPATPA